jgi:ribonuclease T2
VITALSSHDPANAQAWQCAPPANLSRPQIITAAAGEVRRTAVDGYVLALSWSREYCKSRGAGSNNLLQCNGRIGDFGFILHGLWPEAKGPNYPQFCHSAAILSRQLLAQNICMTPDVQLMQHEWAKHGTCMARRPDAYFAAGKLMFEAIEYPDMDRLSRAGQKGAKTGKPLTVAGFAQAMAAINEGLPADAIRVQTNQRGWLKEVRICLAKDFKPRRCPSFTQGARGNSELKIWRGG